MSNLSLRDLALFEGSTPRVLDLRLAEALGFARPRKIRDIIKRYAQELATYGLLRPTVGRVADGDRSATQTDQEFWLNEQQALLVSILSRTPKAAMVRRQVIDVFMGYRVARNIDGSLPVAAALPDGPRLGVVRGGVDRIFNRAAHWAAVAKHAHDMAYELYRVADELRPQSIASFDPSDGQIEFAPNGANSALTDDSEDLA